MRNRTLNQYATILRNDFAGFVHRSFLELNASTQFQHNWHIDLLAEKLEDVRHGRTRRLIVNIPPRGLKSHMASIAFPAWLLGHDPAAKLLCISYGQELSDKLARDCRTLMQSPFYQAVFRTRLSPSRQAVEEFDTTGGGYRLSTSMTGAITGRGADYIIIDDPLKPDDALSEVRRKSVNEGYSGTILSRMNNKQSSAIVLVMQRLHADDLCAYVAERDDWEIVTLPALAEQDETWRIRTPYGRLIAERKTGDALHPDRESAITLEMLRRQMTEYNFAAQYQQDPQPLAGNIVKRAWLKFYKPSDLPEFGLVLQSWDTANKATELADFSVCTTWRVYGQHLYLLDVFRRKLDFPELKRAVRDHARLHEAGVVLIEDKASGTQLIQELRAENFSLVQAAPAIEGDKEIRLRAQTAKIEGGFARFPEETSWLDAYLLELTTFPNAKNDDQVDSTVYALAWMLDRQQSSFERAMTWAKLETEQQDTSMTPARVRIRVRNGGYTYQPLRRPNINVPVEGIIEVEEEDVPFFLRSGCERLD